VILKIRNANLENTQDNIDFFGDKLIDKIRIIGNPLCVGLDPYLDKIPPLFRDGPMTPADPRTAKATKSFLMSLIDLLEHKIAIIKPQSAFFERMGWRGTQLLEDITSYAQGKGFLVLMDAKRGDIGSTAEAYAQSFLTKDAPIKSDALTVSPFLGLDTLEPYIQAARANGSGVFVLVKTSNPGSGDFQDMLVGEKTLFEKIAEKLEPLSKNFEAPRTGWSSLGIVVGATYPAQGENLRELLPHTPFLIPGYGAQGGGAEDAVRTFVKGPNGYEGGIVNSSRAILFPDKGNTNNSNEWETAISDAIKYAVDDLTEALARK
tara:strand:- start:521 stop:1480 length:960 start_codon:yes stop_codon:yes gene_type:complete